MAFNEEFNIRNILEALIDQELKTIDIQEIVVVASGCTDNTPNIVESFARTHSKIKLIVQGQREGKASAINAFLSQAKGELVVVESGDTIPEKNAIERLLLPFQDSEVGMTGAHPVPVNPDKTFMGYTVNLFWRMHHEMALKHPKLGELIAFRNIVREIPSDTAVDEASLESVITRSGYRIHYVPDAVVFNKGAENIRDYLKQRRRIMVGHKHLQKTKGYRVSTMDFRNLLSLSHNLFATMRWNPKTVLWTTGAVCLELLGRFLGDFDYYVKKENPFAWDIAESTKNLKK
jgi:cellulose synthase/poly-beta-1,6-N-acetylglucosamine synthase-like glycosyltransferase